jgi:RES domain-containing protein
VRVWRISTRRRTANAFSGEGTRLAGSRWTHPGLPAVYTSESIALAVLETLVHLDSDELPAQVVIPADIPQELAVQRVNAADLPSDWFATPAPPALRDLGSDWLKRGRGVALGVPSAIVNDEYNWLLNTRHSDFKRIGIGQPRAFAFDGRLWKRQ